MTKAFHLGVSADQLNGAQLAILPGAPERVEKIAASLDNPVFLASQREFCLYRGELNGKPLVVCSTGIGGPSTSIAVEELAQMGITTFLRVGTTGAIQPQVNVGDLIITQASVRLDGASLHFAPLSYPASADFFATQAMVNAAQQQQLTYHVGITASSDTFYPGQERYDTHSGYVVDSLQGSMKQWQQLGVLNYEMESATLFTQCNALGLKAACVAGVLINRAGGEIPDQATIALAEDRAISTVVAAANLLI
ncbi:uridine phosphorylase [Paraferrimonas haliotis]|uniref:Uridine phosphorylase n=1 Tax=Paraferrimonas haliotis TaxID=2013866 RepID=A0AA37TL00_9GAMM|nr:uridine phosphorylase [Paraferrimonas haliotis]GLS83452.1 uridine phosphorylase [Paraferrimonas haliotis]